MSNVLENLLLPVNHDDFIRNIWQTRFECGSPITGRYRKLCDWAALNRILTEQRLVPPRLRLFRNGQQVDPHSFQRRQPLFLLRTECLLNELRNGATLILDVVDEAHEPLRDLSRNLRSSLGAPVHVNLYAAWKRDSVSTRTTMCKRISSFKFMGGSIGRFGNHLARPLLPQRCYRQGESPTQFWRGRVSSKTEDGSTFREAGGMLHTRWTNQACILP